MEEISPGERMALNRIELLTLLAILRLGEKAYGVTIYEDIQRIAGSDVSMAGVYSAVDRLERRGLVRPWRSEPRPERGGRARRHYDLTAAGRERVRQEREMAMKMWRGLALDPSGRRR
jgi:DNA-binding PadR family transcriptional regulator